MSPAGLGGKGREAALGGRWSGDEHVARGGVTGRAPGMPPRLVTLAELDGLGGTGGRAGLGEDERGGREEEGKKGVGDEAIAQGGLGSGEAW